MTAKERPILFSAPMVQAILDGSKSMTRRVMDPQPIFGCDFGRYIKIGKYEGAYCSDHSDDDYEWIIEKCCPYGVTGQRLWVRETTEEFDLDGTILSRYSADKSMVSRKKTDEPDSYPDVYCPHWDYPRETRPSIHMFRCDSRILLEVTDIKIERLQDISEEDAIAEGAVLPKRTCTMYQGICKDAFHVIWDEINGPGAWDANPWVWVISFRRINHESPQ